MDLTLIVAATRSMGIGVNGSLPWSRLEKEMAYFARVTKRLPPNVRNVRKDRSHFNVLAKCGLADISRTASNIGHECTCHGPDNLGEHSYEV